MVRHGHASEREKLLQVGWFGEQGGSTVELKAVHVRHGHFSARTGIAFQHGDRVALAGESDRDGHATHAAADDDRA